MKRLLMTLIFTLGCSNMACAGSMPQEIVVMGKDLKLGYVEGDKQNGFIAKYIPKKETLDNWTLLYAVGFTQLENVDIDINYLADRIMGAIVKRKQEGDKLANGRVLNCDKKSSLLVDFLLSSVENPKKELMFEHNVFRYQTISKGIVSYQIARRFYVNDLSQDDMVKFVTDIPGFVPQMVKEVSNPKADLPFSVK